VINVTSDLDGWETQTSALKVFHSILIWRHFGQFLRLIVDEQGGDGSVANVIPAVRYANRPGDPSWAGALTTIPRVSMQMFADDGAALENFNAMNSFVTYLDAQLNATGMAKFWGQYGDWCPPPQRNLLYLSLLLLHTYSQSRILLSWRFNLVSNRKRSSFRQKRPLVWPL